ncbi:MAG: iron-containing alcohol dehydrogenase, partial [Bacteroidetes bacterium]
TDWTTHMIGHELTAYYGIDHARTLSIILPRLYENQIDNKREKLVQYGKRVWKLEGDDQELASHAIKKTEGFFQSLGIQTKISDYSKDTSEIADHIKQIFVSRGWLKMGERQAITPEDVHSIVSKAI